MVSEKGIDSHRDEINTVKEVRYKWDELLQYVFDCINDIITDELDLEKVDMEMVAMLNNIEYNFVK